MKIWAKVLRGDKILRDVIYECDFSLRPSEYQAMLQEISYRLDIATPVSLPSHLKHFERFNRVKYIPRDFIEDCEFTSVVLERVAEDKKTPSRFLY